MEPKNYAALRSLLKKEQGEKIAPYVFKLENIQTLQSYLQKERIKYETYQEIAENEVDFNDEDLKLEQAYQEIKEEKKTRKDKVVKVRKLEAQKDRPVVILSNDKQNQYSEEVIVALISSQLDKVYYFEPEISLKKPSKILTDQILTIDKSRLGEKITSLNSNEILKLEKALHAVL
ncbi:5386_t:CDS:2, partial [Racocetra persica]